MPSLTLEAVLPPEAAATLFRQPEFAARRAGRTRTSPVTLAWLDTEDGTLAEQGLALEAPARGPARLLRVLPAPDAPWHPGQPDAVAATLLPGAVPEQAGDEPLLPVAGFTGRRLSLALTGGVEASLLLGHLSPEHAVARLSLTGAPDAVLATMRSLAETLPLLPPRCALAEAAAPRPRRLGAPRLDPDGDIDAALRLLIGHLTEVLVWHAPIAAGASDPVGVHQMRVALRRLRSALRAFRGAADAPALRELDRGLKHLAATLGPARDWDVFLAGLGAELAEVVPGDPRMDLLLAAARGHGAAAYAQLQALLASAAFRLLLWDAVALAVTAPWHDPEAPGLADLADRRLEKAWGRLTQAGAEIEHLPDAEFHALRLDGKRLRYLCELFAPLYGRKRARRFLERLAEVQEQFGLANDTAVARALVAPLAQGEAAWAAGVAEGWVLARSRRVRSRAGRAWAGLLSAEPFWNQG